MDIKSKNFIYRIDDCIHKIFCIRYKIGVTVFDTKDEFL